MSTKQPDETYERDVARAREAKVLYREELLRIPGVHGLGIGYKRTGKRRTKEIALVVHVQRKRAPGEIEAAHLVPERLTFVSPGERRKITVPTDVREAAPPVEEVRCGACDSNFGDRVRPVLGGYSVGLATQPGGTLGGWVWDRVNDQTVLISNHHVLGGTSGATVIQPSIGDGGSAPADTIGAVVRAGTLDASIARPFDGNDVDAEIQCSTPAVFEVADATLQMEVEKVGQTTGLTCGLVELIDYDSGHYGSRADLWIDGDGSNFSEPGDSGALYVERRHPEDRTWKRVVGIHWGGSGNDGIGHPLRAVFQDLDVTTVCAGVFEALLEAVFDDRSDEREPRGARRIWPRRAQDRLGLARDLERRFVETDTGAQVATALSQQRVALVRVLATGDGRRSAAALLRPIVGRAVSTDDVLERPVDELDLENAQRLLKVVRRVAPELEPVAALGEGLLGAALGVTIGELLQLQPHRNRGDGAPPPEQPARGRSKPPARRRR